MHNAVADDTELTMAMETMKRPPFYVTREDGKPDTRLDLAVQMILVDKVTLIGDNLFQVQGTAPGTVYTVRDGLCDCPAATKSQKSKWCKHAVATAMWREWQGRLGYTQASLGLMPGPQPEEERDFEAGLAQETAGASPVEAAPQLPAPTIPREFILSIHGKEFVQYAGLLAMAHTQGLTKLEARFISVGDTRALAEATATFADGRSFSEAADATPENVNKGVKAHYARCALTRAKARCLRDALNISMCSVEELD